MKLKKVEPVHDGLLSVQKVTFEDLEGNHVVKERVKHDTKVVGICHDVVNGTVALLSEYQTGAMQTMRVFPSVELKDAEVATKALTGHIEESTGCMVKSCTLLQEYMPISDTDYQPTYLFYCTIDSRNVKEDVELINIRQLVREVHEGAFSNTEVIMGTYYLQLLSHGKVR